MASRKPLSPEAWAAKQRDRFLRATNAARGPEGHRCNGQPCTAFPGCEKWKSGRLDGIPEQQEIEL